MLSEAQLYKKKKVFSFLCETSSCVCVCGGGSIYYHIASVSEMTLEMKLFPVRWL